jgi:O-antigen/teichoic acid export membrane protein
MGQAEPAPAKDWRQVERERAENAERRYRKWRPYMVAVLTASFAGCVVLLVMGLGSLSTWLFTTWSFLNLVYACWQWRRDARAGN